MLKSQIVGQFNYLFTIESAAKTFYRKMISIMGGHSTDKVASSSWKTWVLILRNRVNTLIM